MSKWIAEFDLEDGDIMPEHMDLNYMGAKIDFHCKPMWIPVNEMLPPVDKEVLLTICDNCAYQGFNENFAKVRCGKFHSMGWYVDGVWYHFDNVIAWQPLPELYKTESEE